MICRLDFQCFVGIYLFTFNTFPGQFSFGKNSVPTKKANRSVIVLKVLYYGVRSLYIRQENQVDYDSGGGIINYIP